LPSDFTEHLSDVCHLISGAVLAHEATIMPLFGFGQMPRDRSADGTCRYGLNDRYLSDGAMICQAAAYVALPHHRGRYTWSGMRGDDESSAEYIDRRGTTCVRPPDVQVEFDLSLDAPATPVRFVTQLFRSSPRNAADPDLTGRARDANRHFAR
jgi:hypothetical protein